jgi:hypothetical protein
MRLSGSALPLGALVAGCAGGTAEPAPVAQNPSPMVETTRSHDRLPEFRPDGLRLRVDAGLDRGVDVFVPAAVGPAAAPRLLVHFHGPSYVAEQAVAAQGEAHILAVVNLGAGSGRYENPFLDAARLPALVDAVMAGVEAGAGWRPGLAGLYLSGFSAGCGAIRGVMSTAEGRAAVSGALLLDGIHTSYVPAGTVLHADGRLDTDPLLGILAFAHDAVAERVTLAITHSAIFPGTFASTTETADWLLAELGLLRRAVLVWGPVGMQQLSEVRAGRFSLLGFAGNAAPDHVDHLHGLGAFLRELH